MSGDPPEPLLVAQTRRAWNQLLEVRLDMAGTRRFKEEETLGAVDGTDHISLWMSAGSFDETCILQRGNALLV